MPVRTDSGPFALIPIEGRPLRGALLPSTSTLTELRVCCGVPVLAGLTLSLFDDPEWFVFPPPEAEVESSCNLRLAMSRFIWPFRYNAPSISRSITSRRVNGILLLEP